MGISEDSSIDEELFDLLVEKLEDLGIEEEELSDGYEFMGASSALNNYINKNASRLVRLMGSELDDEVEKEQETEEDEISEKKQTDFYLNSLKILSQMKSRLRL